MPDDQVQIVTDEQGVEHHFPKEATPDMISKAMGLNQGPNLKTGQGMQEYGIQKAKQVFTGTGDQGYYDKTGRKFMGPNGEPLTYMEKAAQDLGDRQTRLAVAQNRAMNSPTPFTNAALPLLGATGLGANVVRQGFKATAKPIIKGVVGAAGGTAAGSYGGRQIGNIFGEPEAGAKIGGIGGGIAGMLMGGMGEPIEPEVFPVSKSPGSYRGPASVPKQKPNPFPWATSSRQPVGNAELPPVPEGPAPLFPAVQPKPKAPTGGAAKPFEPLVYESEAQVNQIAQRNANLKRQASAAGTYHAAQGSANKRTNLQQRIGNKLPWLSGEE